MSKPPQTNPQADLPPSPKGNLPPKQIILDPQKEKTKVTDTTVINLPNQTNDNRRIMT